MISVLKKNISLTIKAIVFVSVLVPLVIVTYETLILGKESVVFLQNYPTIIGVIVLIYYSLLLAMGLFLLMKQLMAVLSLKNETKKNELLHLQSQVNPHFFFNMLNNLYGMVDKDTEKAKNLILKLSDLMRYSIYEGEKNEAFLSEEISYLQNYIELHKMRYHKKISVQFNTEIENDQIKIRPLLLIILVENAFKHGVENLRENAFVTIDLKVNNKILLFNIENNFDAQETPKTVGIGLKNLKRRLELAYPKKHKFVIDKKDSIYKAELELYL